MSNDIVQASFREQCHFKILGLLLCLTPKYLCRCLQCSASSSPSPWLSGPAAAHSGPEGVRQGSRGVISSSFRFGVTVLRKHGGSRRKALCFLGACLQESGLPTPHTGGRQPVVVEVRMQGQGLPSHCQHWCGAAIEQHTLATRLRQGNEMYASGWPQDSH